MNRTTRMAMGLIVLLSAWNATGQSTDLQLSVHLEADRDRIYQDEVFSLTLYIRSSGIRLGQSFSLQSWPPDNSLQKLTDFVEMPIARRQEGTRIYEVRSFRCSVRAIAADSIQLSPVIRFGVLTPINSPFGQRWVETAQEAPVQPLTLTIRPLPVAGRPPTFAGAVGQFTLAAQIDPSDVAVGDLVRLKTRIAGNGYIAGLVPPRVLAGPHFKVYEPQAAQAADDRARVFEQILVPQNTNAAFVPPVSFSYFDPQAGSGEYRTLTRGPFPLTFHAVHTSEIQPFRPSLSPASRRPQSGQISPPLRPLYDLPMGPARLALAFSPHVWLAGAVGAAVLSVLALVTLGLRLGPRSISRLAGWLGIGALALCVACFTLNRRMNADRAVLLVQETARFAPAHGAAVSFPLPAGTVVRVVGTAGDWLKVESASDRGWLPAASVARLDTQARTAYVK